MNDIDQEIFYALKEIEQAKIDAINNINKKDEEEKLRELVNEITELKEIEQAKIDAINNINKKDEKEKLRELANEITELKAIYEQYIRR